MAMPKAKLTKLILDELAAVPTGAQDVQGTAILKSKDGKAKQPTAIEKSVSGARKWLKQAIARHERHMNGTEATSDKSQQKMMDEMKSALEELGVKQDDEEMDMKKRGEPTAIAKRSALTTPQLGHTHVLYGIDDSMAGTTSHESTFVDGAPRDHYTGHCHPWVRSEDGAITVGEAMGHTHEVGMMSAPLTKAIVDEKTQATAKSQVDALTKSTPAAEMPQVQVTKESIMDPKDQQIADLQKSLGALRKLSTLEHALWKSLEGADADAFLAKSDRSADLAEFEKSNAVEYTAEDGTIYRKSQAPMAKLHKMADDERKLRLGAELKKRAADTIGALAGNDEVHVEILKAVEGIKDEAVRGAALETLKAANNAMVTKRKAPGVGGESPTDESPVTKFNTQLAEFAKSKNMTPVKATAAFVETPEGASLYDELLAAQQ